MEAAKQELKSMFGGAVNTQIVVDALRNNDGDPDRALDELLARVHIMNEENPIPQATLKDVENLVTSLRANRGIRVQISDILEPVANNSIIDRGLFALFLDLQTQQSEDDQLLREVETFGQRRDLPADVFVATVETFRQRAQESSNLLNALQAKAIEALQSASVEPEPEPEPEPVFEEPLVAPVFDEPEPVEEPIIPEPKVEEPIVEEPIVEEPKVEEPIVPEPKVEEPIIPEPVEEPVIPEPVEEPVIPEPKVEEPIIPEPKVEEPIVEEPIVEEPVIPEPKVEEPIIPEPKVEEPIVEEPIVEEPIIPEPVEEPVVEEPIIPEPKVEEPIVEEPIVEEPIIPEPVEEPVVEEPVIPEPKVEEPVIPEPEVEEPVVEEPIIPEPVEEPIIPEPVIPEPIEAEIPSEPLTEDQKKTIIDGIMCQFRIVYDKDDVFQAERIETIKQTLIGRGIEERLIALHDSSTEVDIADRLNRTYYIDINAVRSSMDMPITCLFEKHCYPFSRFQEISASSELKTLMDAQIAEFKQSSSGWYGRNPFDFVIDSTYSVVSAVASSIAMPFRWILGSKASSVLPKSDLDVDFHIAINNWLIRNEVCTLRVGQSSVQRLNPEGTAVSSTASFNQITHVLDYGHDTVAFCYAPSSNRSPDFFRIAPADRDNLKKLLAKRSLLFNHKIVFADSSLFADVLFPSSSPKPTPTATATVVDDATGAVAVPESSSESSSSSSPPAQ